MAKDYAERHGLTLADEELADRGVSGYSGANMDDESALGAFVQAVHRGHVPRGSILLVEALDRLSRQAAWRASTLLGNLCLAGLTVVTLNDERTYSAEELDRDQFALFYAVVGFMRGHDESANKARRLRQKWEARRAAVARGERTTFTRICPAWLKHVEDMHGPGRHGFKLNPERAPVVAWLFQQTLAGVGRHTLAQQLNARGVAPWGKAGTVWRGSYIATVLRNRACVGDFVPEVNEKDPDTHKRRRKPLEPVPAYYPAAVDAETFQRVQSMLDNAGAPQRGRHAGAELVNVFGGLLRCAGCGGAAVTVSKGTNRHRGERAAVRHAVCERAKVGAARACAYRSVRLEALEAAFRAAVTDVILAAPAGSDSGALADELADATAAVRAAKLAVSDAADAYAAGRLVSLRERLRAAEATLSAAEAHEQETAARWQANAGPVLNMKLAQLAEAVAVVPWDRRAVNAALRQCFRAVVLDVGAEELRLEWAQGGGVAVVGYGEAAEELARKRGRRRGRKLAEPSEELEEKAARARAEAVPGLPWQPTDDTATRRGLAAVAVPQRVRDLGDGLTCADY